MLQPTPLALPAMRKTPPPPPIMSPAPLPAHPPVLARTTTAIKRPRSTVVRLWLVPAPSAPAPQQFRLQQQKQRSHRRWPPARWPTPAVSVKTTSATTPRPLPTIPTPPPAPSVTTTLTSTTRRNDAVLNPPPHPVLWVLRRAQGGGRRAWSLKRGMLGVVWFGIVAAPCR